MSMGDFPVIMSQQILVGIVLVGRLGVEHGQALNGIYTRYYDKLGTWLIYIYIYIHNDIY